MVMGWLTLVGSIKLQVSLAKETYKRDDILQKRPVILSILLTVATLFVKRDLWLREKKAFNTKYNFFDVGRDECKYKDKRISGSYRNRRCQDLETFEFLEKIVWYTEKFFLFLLNAFISSLVTYARKKEEQYEYHSFVQYSFVYLYYRPLFQSTTGLILLFFQEQRAVVLWKRGQ